MFKFKIQLIYHFPSFKILHRWVRQPVRRRYRPPPSFSKATPASCKFFKYVCHIIIKYFEQYCPKLIINLRLEQELHNWPFAPKIQRVQPDSTALTSLTRASPLEPPSARPSSSASDHQLSERGLGALLGSNSRNSASDIGAKIRIK